MNDINVAFAFYKNSKLIGYRQDTIGSIGMKPKLYSYSKEQVETCLRNIQENVKNPSVFANLINIIGDSPEMQALTNVERDVHEMFQRERAFEVRVVKTPEYRKEFNVNTGQYEKEYFGGYPHEEIAIWLQSPETHEVIETHYFGIEGQLLLS